MSIAAGILAAGASTRLGEPKQLVTLGGERLLERAVRIATEAGCTPVLAVLGSRAEEIRTACDLQNSTVIHNAAWRTGMASSLHAAVAALAAGIQGLVLMTCDQPAVSVAHLRQLIHRSTVASQDENSDALPVGSGYAGRVGTPAYFPAGWFGRLSQVEGDEGARELLRGALAIDLPGGDLDIDTPASLQQARNLFASGTE